MSLEELDFHPDSYSVSVFDYPQTIALRDALLTNKPIVLIDYGQVDLAPRARELLEKRIRIVRCKQNAENRIDVDWTEFLSALEDAPSLTDASFFDTYFKNRL